MADSADFEMNGFADLFGQLYGLADEKTLARILAYSGRKAMAPVESAQRDGLRFDSGDTRSSIVTRSRRGGDGKNTVVTILVGPLKAVIPSEIKASRWWGISNPALRVRFQEFGTAFIEARPVIRPSLENNVEQVIDILGDELGKSLARIKKRKAKGK